MENNPFEMPDILDRRIEVFTACNKCNNPFQDRNGKLNFRHIQIPVEGNIARIKCNTCKTEYTFRNWNTDNQLGLHEEE